jgi:hypothetical protein
MRPALKNAMRKLKFGYIFVFDIPYAKVEATTPGQANANLLTVTATVTSRRATVDTLG